MTDNTEKKRGLVLTRPDKPSSSGFMFARYVSPEAKVTDVSFDVLDSVTLTNEKSNELTTESRTEKMSCLQAIYGFI